jgi:hypothetical protein
LLDGSPISQNTLRTGLLDNQPAASYECSIREMPASKGDDRITVVRLAMKHATTANSIGGLPDASTKGRYKSTGFPKIG